MKIFLRHCFVVAAFLYFFAGAIRLTNDVDEVWRAIRIRENDAFESKRSILESEWRKDAALSEDFSGGVQQLVEEHQHNRAIIHLFSLQIAALRGQPMPKLKVIAQFPTVAELVEEHQLQYEEIDELARIRNDLIQHSKVKSKTKGKMLPGFLGFSVMIFLFLFFRAV